MRYSKRANKTSYWVSKVQARWSQCLHKADSRAATIRRLVAENARLAEDLRVARAGWDSEILAGATLLRAAEEERDRLAAGMERLRLDRQAARNEHADMKSRLDDARRQISDWEEGDRWHVKAEQAVSLGVCPACFASDEMGHFDGCPWGTEVRSLQDELEHAKTCCDELEAELVEKYLAGQRTTK